jgi:hypothetical protein
MFKGEANTNGRPKGSLNKTTASIKEAYTKLVEGNIEQLKTDLKALTAKDRIKAILELSKFILPTIKAVEIDDGIGTKRDLGWLDDFSESDLEKLLKNAV